MSSKKIIKKIFFILIFVIFSLQNIFSVTFGERDYVSCTKENWDLKLLSKDPSVWYCNQVKVGTDIDGNDTMSFIVDWIWKPNIICKRLDNNISEYKNNEKKLKLQVKDLCCEVDTFCSSAREFVLYESFMKAVLGEINPSGNQSIKLAQEYWLFSNNVLRLGISDSNILLWLAKWFIQNANQKAQTTLATSIILWSVTTEFATKDWPSFFTMLFQSQQIFSDYNKLLEIDSMIHDSVFELWLNWKFISKMSESSINKINNLIQEYSSNWIFVWDSSSLTKWVNISTVIKMFMKANNAMKTLVSLWIIEQFDYQYKDEEGNDKALWRSDKNINLKFNMDAMEALKYKYKCARLSTKCNAWIANFMKNMKNLWEDLKSWPKESLKIIKDANKNFRYFMFGGKKLSDEEKENASADINQIYMSLWIVSWETWMTQMWNWRGVMADTLTKTSNWIWKFVWSVVDKFENKWDKKNKEENKKQTQKLIDNIPDEQIEDQWWFFRNKVQDWETSKQKKEKLVKKLDDAQKSLEPTQEYKDYLASIVENVLQDQEFDEVAITMANNTDIIPYFTAIFNKIDNVIKKIGNNWENSSDDTIIKQLWEACENQWKNKGWKCYAN